MPPPAPMPDMNIDDFEGPLGQRVHHALRGAILDLRFAPGAILSKGVLCERLGVSRSPVGSALERLSSEGLVDIVPRSATRVSRFSLEALREESFLREAIEGAAVARVAAARTDAQVAHLSRILRHQKRLLERGDFPAFFAADREFHELILGFTGFPKVAMTAGQISLHLHRARVLLLPEAGRAAETVAEHRAILDAIRARDPDAARAAMSTHLRRLIERIAPLERRHPDYFR